MINMAADPDNGVRDHCSEFFIVLAEVLHFIVKYESAEWQEVSRQLVLKNIEIPDVSHAWVSSLQWYAKLIAMNE